MSLAEEKISYLQSKVLAKRREKKDAFERAHVARLDSEELKARLKEEVALQEALRQENAQVDHKAEQQHNSLLAQIQELEIRVVYLESSAFETKIIKKYHSGTLNKVEVALAYKAGFDYLKAQLPPELLLKEDQFK